MLYLVKKMKSVQCCGFSLSFWDGGSVVKERLAFAINEVAILFQAKLLEGPAGSWVCKWSLLGFPNSGPACRLIEDPICTIWASTTSSHIRQALSMLISPCVVIWAGFYLLSLTSRWLPSGSTQINLAFICSQVESCNVFSWTEISRDSGMALLPAHSSEHSSLISWVRLHK